MHDSTTANAAVIVRLMNQALSEIRSQREKHFDPDVVDVFEGALES